MMRIAAMVALLVGAAACTEQNPDYGPGNERADLAGAESNEGDGGATPSPDLTVGLGGSPDLTMAHASAPDLTMPHGAPPDLAPPPPPPDLASPSPDLAHHGDDDSDGDDGNGGGDGGMGGKSCHMVPCQGNGQCKQAGCGECDKQSHHCK